MTLMVMEEAAGLLGVAPQTLAYYRRKGQLTAKQSKRAWLVDPDVARKELEQAGFYRRRANRRRNKQKLLQSKSSV